MTCRRHRLRRYSTGQSGRPISAKPTMPKLPPAKPPSSPPIAITCVGNIVTVTCGADSQKAACASPGSAKSLATRLKNDPQFLKRWMGFKLATQLPLPIEGGAEHCDQAADPPGDQHTSSPNSERFSAEPAI